MTHAYLPSDLSQHMRSVSEADSVLRLYIKSDKQAFSGNFLFYSIITGSMWNYSFFQYFWQKEETPSANSCFCDPTSHKLQDVILELQDKNSTVSEAGDANLPPTQDSNHLPSQDSWCLCWGKWLDSRRKQNRKLPCTSGHSKKNNNNIISKTRFCHHGAN